MTSWNWNFIIAVVLLVVGFLLYSLFIDRTVTAIGQALMAGGAVACAVLLLKHFVFDRMES
ncbi:MAG TPA: hypothetical protein VG742_06290 [Dongiaceae bacterium]|jgi:hypothetical protein|nr:hypothetical protein [Dongiaceae bacterium]